MQQQICPTDQMSNQQQPQQVMLCPVRLVYETQILVQPGEQIQPNQTLFINPQNPPPWIQNRAQNQVIYMQQLPNNIVPSVPQHIDQNQLYIQNYAYPQQMMNQMDHMRQMPNVMAQNVMAIPQNMTQNVNQSIAQNVGLNVGQNVMPMSNLVQNVQKVGASYSQNVGNDRVVYSAQNANTIAMTQAVTNVNQMQERTVQLNQNLVNMQKVSELQGLRQPVQNVRQPQVTVSPMQNVKFAPNVGDVRPISRPQMTTSNVVNNVVQNNMQVNMVKKVPLPNKASPSNVIPNQNQVRHFNQTYYRPIQPRPMSVMPIVQNQNQYLPMQTASHIRPQTHILNTELIKKRKSESPDETRKKIPNTGNQQINHLYANQTVKVHSEIGVNTNPIVRQVKTVETASTGTQANIAKEKQIDVQRVMEIKAIPTVKDNNIQTENDKLVRNTVFTQARGLLRTEPQILQPDIISIEKIENVTMPRPTSAIDNIDKEVVKSSSTKLEQMEVKNEIKIDTVKSEIKIDKVKDEVKLDIVKEIPKEIAKNDIEQKIKLENVTKPEPPKVKEEAPIITKTDTEKKPLKAETKDIKEANKKITVTAISDFRGNEIQIADGNVRKEDTDSFILTHVLDGYVIQESNMAFPIRKPLKEKTIYQNTDLGTERKEETYKHRTEDGKVIKDNSRILAISDLNLSEDSLKEEVKTDENCDDQPFVNLTPNTIKSWTVDELATHLSKYNWTETISVLAEHEIDGESLFLVSKPQLVQIGVSEAHAEVICEFIKK